MFREGWRGSTELRSEETVHTGRVVSMLSQLFNSTLFDSVPVVEGSLCCNRHFSNDPVPSKEVGLCVVVSDHLR